MTINRHKYEDELIFHATTPGYRKLSLAFKLKKGDSKHEEIEINLDKEDVGELLEVLFKLFTDAYSGCEHPIDWEEGEIEKEEVRAVLEFYPKYSLSF